MTTEPRRREPDEFPDDASVFEGPAIFGNDLQLLIDVLPQRIRRELQKHDLDDLIEVVMDLGRVPEARFADRMVDLADAEKPSEYVTMEELNHVAEQIGFFSSDNRGGIPRTLHRISCIRNRQGEIVGLTCRVGRLVTGTIDCIRDIVESGRSILILGRPGVGKTTRLREMAKLMSDDIKKRVVIVDTSNEIAGDGDIPHPAVGKARRMQVSHHDLQKDVMIEAVQNHTPEVIIVDEIGTEQEALASRTIAERGVILVATAHGSTLDNLIKNPMLSDLIGGVETVTLGDDEARRRGTQKSVLERANRPTFDVCIELRDRNTVAVYPDVAEAVDHILRGWQLFPELRKVDSETGETKVLKSDIAVLPVAKSSSPRKIKEELVDDNTEPSLTVSDFTEHSRDTAAMHPEQPEFRVFIHGLSKSYLDRILERLNLHSIRVTKNIYDAHALLALKSDSRPGSRMMKLAQDYEIPVYFAKTNTMPQIQRSLREALDAEAGTFAGHLATINEDACEDETEVALREAQDAIDKVLKEEKAVELAPRRSYIRRLQHELIEQSRLLSVSVGDEPNRRLKVLPPKERRKSS